METQGIFSALRTTLSGMSAQMKRMNVISENIANAEKAPDENGNVYQRKVIIHNNSENAGIQKFGNKMRLAMRRTNSAHLGLGSENIHSVSKQKHFDVDVKSIDDAKTIYDPGHPLANNEGFVKMPNISIVEEMVDMVATSRNYEANVSVMTAAKNMAKKALEI